MHRIEGENMKNFIYGLIFGFIGIPILESITDVLVTYFEIPKAFASKKILRENKIIKDLQSEDIEIDTHVMGFDIKSSEDYEEDDDDLEDKKRNKKRR